MITRYLLAALVAGLFSGVLMTAAQEARVIPLILHAEEFEGGGEEAPAADGATSTETHEHSSLHLGAVLAELASALSPVTRFARSVPENRLMPNMMPPSSWSSPSWA